MLADPAFSRELNLNHRCESISPVYAAIGPCYRLLNDIFEGMVRVDKDGKPEPGVAKSWDVNSADKSITFHLNPDKRWSDGTPVIADDFALAWKSILSTSKNHNALYFALLNIAGARQYSEGYFKALKGIKVIDSTTLRIEFEKFDPLFYLRTLNAALFPIPSHFAKKHGESWSNRTDIPFNGQYKPKLTSLLHSSGHSHLDLRELQLVKNDFHPESNHLKITEIKYRYLAEKDVPKRNALRYYTDSSTAPDISYVSAGNSKLIKKFIKEKDWSLIDQPSTAVYLLSMNRNYMATQLVEAIKHIIDAEEVFSRASRHLEGNPTQRLVQLPNLKSYSNLPLNNHYYNHSRKRRHDIAAALLKELEITPVTRKTLTLLVTSDDQSSHLAKVLHPILSPFGIDLKIDVPTAKKSFDKKRIAGHFDLSIYRWFVALPDPSGFFISMSQLPRIFTISDQEDFDKLLLKANNSSGKKRLELFRDAEEFYLNKSSAIPIARPALKLLARNNLCGVTPAQSLMFPSAWLSWCPE